MTQLYALGLGVGTQNSKGQWLEVFYPTPLLNPSPTTIHAVAEAINYQGGNATVQITSAQLQIIAHSTSELASVAQSLLQSQQPIAVVVLAADSELKTVPEAYLKLQLLSHRLVKPHETVLEGIFSVLPNVAWTNKGAIDVEELGAAQLNARIRGEVLSVESVDKFPKMANYVIPKGVRIAATSRVRLGAYLGEGTTVMHEGFVNFNAGTLGTSMVEGRISGGVVVGEGSDLGGGCSTMGTLSGGGMMVIGIGRECLIGANAGIGIPLGDRCTIEAGLYVTAGTKVALLDNKNQFIEHVKARELAGKDDLLFRRNSMTGAVECIANRNAIALNTLLHSNN
jgi:2,3,4,5-tetrahydropyridine-2,6-dicarboxylate N-succinyltransferase